MTPLNIFRLLVASNECSILVPLLPFPCVQNIRYDTLVCVCVMQVVHVNHIQCVAVCLVKSAGVCDV